MTNEAELKPCPFCGSTAIVIGSRDGYHTQARCGFCFAAGPTHLEKAEATAAWNQRPEAKPEVVTIDLEREAYRSLQQAASQSTWIPSEYMSNDWLADCERFLRTGEGVLKQEAAPDVVGLLREARRYVGYCYRTWAREPGAVAKECLARIDAALESGRE